jgi:hypothetical protein
VVLSVESLLMNFERGRPASRPFSLPGFGARADVASIDHAATGWLVDVTTRAAIQIGNAVANRASEFHVARPAPTHAHRLKSRNSKPDVSRGTLRIENGNLHCDHSKRAVAKLNKHSNDLFCAVPMGVAYPRQYKKSDLDTILSISNGYEHRS